MAKLVNCDSIAPDWQPGSLVMARSWPHRWDLQLALHVLRCEGADGASKEEMMALAALLFATVSCWLLGRLCLCVLVAPIAITPGTSSPPPSLNPVRSIV